MRTAALLFQLSALLVFSQLFTGGPFLLTGSDIVGGIHIVMGFVTFIVVVAAVIAAWRSKPAYSALRYSGIAILLLIALVGFTSKGGPADNLPQSGGLIIHYELAVILFGAAIASTFYAVRWNRMQKPAVAAPSISK